MAGRLALIKSSIHGSFLHSFMIYKWPDSLLKRMERAIRNFLWTRSVVSKKLVSIKWDVCCKPFDEGGIDLKRLHLMNKAFLGRVASKTYSKYHFVYDFLRCRFFSKGDASKRNIFSSIWPSIRSVLMDFKDTSQWFLSSNSKLKFLE